MKVMATSPLIEQERGAGGFETSLALLLNQPQVEAVPLVVEEARGAGGFETSLALLLNQPQVEAVPLVVEEARGTSAVSKPRRPHDTEVAA